MGHRVPELTVEAVECALASLGYGEPDLDGDLSSESGQRVDQLLEALLAVTEAHLRERMCPLGELYFAVADHLAEDTCDCSFGVSAGVPAPRRPVEDGAAPAAAPAAASSCSTDLP